MEPKDNERIADRWLDVALKQYGIAEPRAGLEGRVLANLQAEKESLAGRRNWWPAVAACAVVAVVVGVLFLMREHSKARKQIAGGQMTINQPQGPLTSRREPEVKTVPVAAPRRKSAQSKRLHLAETSEPRLAQFPAPRPLTRQEQLLVRYVHERPEEAKREAQAQAELFQRSLAEFEKQYGLSESQRIHTTD